MCVSDTGGGGGRGVISVFAQWRKGAADKNCRYWQIRQTFVSSISAVLFNLSLKGKCLFFWWPLIDHCADNLLRECFVPALPVACLLLLSAPTCCA